MYSYAANGRAETPCRLSLTGCKGEIRSQLEKISGFNNWVMHKEEKSYIEVFQDRKEDLVYLTADSGTLLEKLDISKIYVVGGLVDRNRWKGLTAEKAMNQGIATAKLPIGEHMKMLSSQVMSVGFPNLWLTVSVLISTKVLCSSSLILHNLQPPHTQLCGDALNISNWTTDAGNTAD